MDSEHGEPSEPTTHAGPGGPAGRPRLAVGAPEGHGRYGQLTTVTRAAGAPGALRASGRDRAGHGEDRLLVCHECGRACADLGVHAARAHHLPAAAYRARHGLPRTTALVAPATRVAMAAGWARHAGEHTERLQAMASSVGPGAHEAARGAAHPAQERARWAGTDGRRRRSAPAPAGGRRPPRQEARRAQGRRPGCESAATLAGVDPAWRAALVAELGDAADVAGWAARARVVLAREELSKVALSRLCGLADATVGMRLAASRSVAW